jgi:hypothetical protein
VLYLFLLRPGLDLFLNSEVLAQHYGLLRPQRQSCGLLFGASFIHRNDYARYIVLKFVLDKPIQYKADPDYLIPSSSEDKFLDRLIAFADDNGCTQIRPWVCEPKADRERRDGNREPGI